MTKRLLFVDDEPNVLSGLRRLLRPLSDEWDMSFAEGGGAALDLMTREAFDVIVTDMRMPFIDGLAVLEAAKAHDPGVVRIVLSGQTEKEDLVRATGVAHQFISKPCGPEQLKAAVERATRLRAHLGNDALTRIVGGLSTLPSLPALYLELTAAMYREGASIKAIAGIIARDLAMTAKVLQLANSPFFCIPRHVDSIAQAVMLLGEEVIRTLVLTDTLFKAFVKGMPLERFTTLWQHGLVVGAAAEALARDECRDTLIAHQALQAGMLHDIGKLILATALPAESETASALALAENRPLHEAERQVFGCDHGQVGAYLLSLWGLPDAIVEAVCYHHTPQEGLPVSGHFTPLTAVHVANVLVHRLALQSGVDAGELDFHDGYLGAIGMRGRIEAWTGLVRERIGTQEVLQ